VSAERPQISELQYPVIGSAAAVSALAQGHERIAAAFPPVPGRADRATHWVSRHRPELVGCEVRGVLADVQALQKGGQRP
jgi:hypothetical protein